MVISVLDLYFITYSWSWSVNDGRAGVESASVAVIVQPPVNHSPEVQDQDVSVNENRPIEIKLEAKDPDDNKLRFILVSQPSHGRIVQFSGQAGTLAYVEFRVHDGIAFSKIKIERMKN
jgi:hypothetical protein